MSNTLPPTKPLDSGDKQPRRRLKLKLPRITRQNLKAQVQHWLSPSYSGHWLVVAIALLAGLATIKHPMMVQLLERNLQTVFFDLRGQVDPPGNQPGELGIVILAMDGDTLTQGSQIYPTDPKQYAYFKPVEQWPWKRTAYAIAIDRLMQAGARAVVLDIVLDALGTYGPEDDEQLRNVLKKYAGRVTLAAQYQEEENRIGYETKLLTPNSVFQSAAPNIGFINFPLSPNGRIHELGSEYFKRIEQTHIEAGLSISKVPSFAESALLSAQVPHSPPPGTDIFFHGPNGTFEHVPFWHVLDPENWNNYHLKNQTFKNKIVLIGPTTGGSFQDFHRAPFSATLRYPEEMAGVEIQANAIATLMQGKAIGMIFPNPVLQGLWVVVLVLGAAYIQSRKRRRLLRRFVYGLVIALALVLLSYALFVGKRLVMPTTVPVIAIVLSSATYLLTDIVGDRNIVKRLARLIVGVGNPDLESAVSELDHSDIQDVVEQHQREFIGRKLKGRYVVLEKIGTGGFGETYKAIDTQRPNSPTCVVKRLRPANKSARFMRLAEALFKREAEVLEQLGKHPQIPQLLAYSPGPDEFYLVQEYIDGISLAEELKMHKLLRPLSEQKVVIILCELLEVLNFVHQQDVIHRDIKPANVIRRRSDKKLVLIDFGAVKQRIGDLEETSNGTNFTVAIGTEGYMAPEQTMGRPCKGSDIYSLGMTGIRALTGIEPSKLESKRNGNITEVDWKTNVQISQALTQILDKMIRFDASDRYQSTQEVMHDLKPLCDYAYRSGFTPDSWEFPAELDTDLEELSATDETKQWMSDVPIVELPATDTAEFVDSNLDETKPWAESNTELPPTDSDQKK